MAAEIESTYPEPPTEDYPAGGAPVYELDPTDYPDDDFEYREKDYTPLDPGHDAFDRFTREAAGRDNPGMVGLEWLEADGTRYRVSSYEQLTQEKDVVKKTLLPRIVKRSIAGPTIERSERPVGTETVKVDHRTVDVIGPDGEIIDILTFTGTRREALAQTQHLGYPDPDRWGLTEHVDVDVFRDYFSDQRGRNPNAVPIPREVVGFRWAEEELAKPEVKRVGRVPAPERPIRTREPGRPELMSPQERTQQLFERLGVQQAELGLDDWRGLTWNTVEENEDGEMVVIPSSYSQIIRDEIVMKRDAPPWNEYVERMFDVRTTTYVRDRENRVITLTERHMYTLDELWELFHKEESDGRKLERRREKAHMSIEGASSIPPRLPLHLRWDTGQPQHNQDEEEQEGGRGPEQGTDITFERALDMLTYDDLEQPKDEQERRELEDYRAGLRSDKNMQTLAHELRAVLGEQGLQRGRFTEIVKQLREDYKKDFRRLFGADAKHDLEFSYTWIINQMLAVYKGSRGRYNPFEDNDDGHELRSQIVSHHLGSGLIKNAFDIKKMSKGERNGKGDDGDDKGKEDAVFLRAQKPVPLKRMRHLLYRRHIDELLQKEKEYKKKEGPALNDGELIVLGSMLRLSLGRPQAPGLNDQYLDDQYR